MKQYADLMKYLSNSNGISHRIRTSNPKICMAPCKTQLAKAVLRENSKTRGIMLPDFKMYCKAIVLEIAWYWHIKTDSRSINRLRAHK